MAWKFVSANDIEGRARRQVILDQIAVWWETFAGKLSEIERELSGGPDAAAPSDPAAGALPIASPDLHGWMDEQLGRIDPRLSWEFGNDEGGGRRLVISPRQHLQLRPMTQSILARAPQLPGWTFLGHGPPLQTVEAIETVRRRTGHGVVAPTALARIGDQNRIDMIFKLKQARTDPAAAKGIAAALTEAVLGEEAADRWVGDLDVEELSRGPVPDQYLGMPQLRATVTGLALTVGNHLPARPYHTHSAPGQWNTLKFTARPEADYARQDDLAIGRTFLPKVRAAALGNGPGKPPRFPFYSASFSRHGEIFCYLKIDVPDVSMDRRRQRKYELEDKIDPALRKAGIGCVFGSNTGLRYVYFDLAVTDLKKTMAALGPVLLAKNLPERSWLLFYDTELADEAVGLRSTTGPPPAAKPFEFAGRRTAPPPTAPPEVEVPSESELFPNDL